MPGRPILETERLRLREFVEEDVAVYYALGSDAAVTRYTGAGRLESLEQALQVLRENPLSDYREHGFGRWACVLKATGAIIGFAGLKHLDDLGEVDVACWLLPAYWGAGLATEAGGAVLNYGFERLHLERVIGLVDPENVRSVRMLEKLGMRRIEETQHHGEATLKYVIEKMNTSW